MRRAYSIFPTGWVMGAAGVPVTGFGHDAGVSGEGALHLGRTRQQPVGDAAQPASAVLIGSTDVVRQRASQDLLQLYQRGVQFLLALHD
jgi:hypothetical protein